jgi:acetyl-CoA carboxylase biotin carboxylase subunit
MVDARLRRRLFRYARRMIKGVRYRNVGTLEFLVDSSRRAYFLEMNTRIQVEHTVTEMATGVDLVRAQIMEARAERLKMVPEDVKTCGHALECRINAEDPEKDFMPSPGRITRFVAPGGMGVRVDTHVYEGYSVPPFYDSLLAKLITFGKTREETIERMARALGEMVIEGVKTTIPLYRKVVQHPVFLSGRYYVGWLEKMIAGEK